MTLDAALVSYNRCFINLVLILKLKLKLPVILSQILVLICTGDTDDTSTFNHF